MAHTHHHDTDVSDSRLLFAIVLNLALSVVEIIGGVFGGSLSLLADALHNFNDCASLFIALIARRVARRQADEFRTFGYRRAEVVGALINLTALVLVSLYLVYQAIQRYFHPEEIDGWTVASVATFALIVDVSTVILLKTMGTGSVNVRAAALHNLSDALASVGVIIVGLSVVFWSLDVLDILVTFAIAGYILWQSAGMLRETVGILMESVPPDIDVSELQKQLAAIPLVRDVHHLHLWQLDEHQRAFEAHIVVDAGDLVSMEQIKQSIKQKLKSAFDVTHSTLEFEIEGETDAHDTTTIPPH